MIQCLLAENMLFSRNSRQALQLCDDLGIITQPTQLGGLLLFPLLAWHHAVSCSGSRCYGCCVICCSYLATYSQCLLAVSVIITTATAGKSSSCNYSAASAAAQWEGCCWFLFWPASCSEWQRQQGLP
jgi:hypothetical protein